MMHWTRPSQPLRAASVPGSGDIFCGPRWALLGPRFGVDFDRIGSTHLSDLGGQVPTFRGRSVDNKICHKTTFANHRLRSRVPLLVGQSRGLEPSSSSAGHRNAGNRDFEPSYCTMTRRRFINRQRISIHQHVVNIV